VGHTDVLHATQLPDVIRSPEGSLRIQKPPEQLDVHVPPSCRTASLKAALASGALVHTSERLCASLPSLLDSVASARIETVGEPMV